MTDGKIIGLDIKPKFVQVIYTSNEIEDGDVTPKEHTVKVFRAPSQNLFTILKSLIAHGIIKCGWDNGLLGEKELQSRKIVDMPDFKDYKIKGFKLSGDDEEEKLSIKLEKTCKNDDVIALNIPKIGIANGTYAHDDILAEDLDSVISEIRSFVSGENYWKPGEQGDLFKSPVDEVVVEDEDDI